MHTIKITPNLLFEYLCTSGKFIRLPNRIESKLFSPELECSTALSCGVVCVILIASRGKKRVHSVVNICYKYTQQVEAARMVGDTTTCSRQNHHRPVGLCVCLQNFQRKTRGTIRREGVAREQIHH